MSFEKIKEVIQSSIAVKEAIYHSDALLTQINKLADLCLQSLKSEGKVIFAGNGEALLTLNI